MVFRQLVYLIAEENTLKNDESNSTLFGLIDFFMYSMFFIRIHKFFSSFWFFFLCQLRSGDLEVKGEKQLSETELNVSRDSNVSGESGEIKRNEVETVMANMGLFCSSESDELEEKYSSKEFSELFDENEPSLEEVKMAFDVFDENKDGFIDAMELKRVMCILGFKEGSKVENCRKMIKNFDANQDGRIDFIEFVKIMENRLC